VPSANQPPSSEEEEEQEEEGGHPLRTHIKNRRFSTRCTPGKK
jgi:hypothetical protein